MAKNWATSAAGTSVDLHLDLRLDLPAGRGAGAALVRALREAVRSGRLAPGTRLPSSRALAADLGLARNTVADAYGELAAEGWLTARQGSGTRVAPRASPRRRAPSAVPLPTHPLLTPARYSLRSGSPDVSAFPRAAWTAAVRRSLTAAPSEAFGHQGPAGRPELRRALADYLVRARGVDAHPDRVVVCSGFVQALTLLSTALRAHGVRSVACETYGLPFHRDRIAAAGLRPVPLRLDADGARTGDLPGSGAQAALLTPAHQFPTGDPLPPGRRASAVDWARRGGGLLLEDDYDGEFRYDRRPVGALQGLDPDRVVYCGTASKSLAPALRLGWMVVPDALVPDVLAAKGVGEETVSALDQLALAEFLVSGGYDRHVRAMRQRYRRRRDRLVEVLARRAPHVRVTGLAAGLHALLDLPPGTEEAVLERAGREELAVSGLGPLTWEPHAPRRDALVVGYATPPGHLFPAALEVLCRVLSAPDRS